MLKESAHGQARFDPETNLLDVIRRLCPTLPFEFVPASDAELGSLGLDSLGRIELFIELEEAFRVSLASLQKFSRGSCTYGDLRALVTANCFDSDFIPS